MSTPRERCRKIVAGVGLNGYPCSRKAVRAGFCAQHDPVNVQARRDAVQTRYDARWARHEAVGKVEECADAVVAAAEAWADINDPNDQRAEVALSYAVTALREARESLNALTTETR